MSRRVVLGGTRSGKSGRGEDLAMATGAPVVYVATGRASDPEMIDRIALHQTRRSREWRTIETADLEQVFATVEDDATVLVDDLDGWLVDRMTRYGLWVDELVAPLTEADRDAQRGILEEISRWWRDAGARTGVTIVTAGQSGWGPTPASASTRRWLDLHGEILQLLTADADAVELVVAGVPLPLLGDPVDSVPGALRDHGDRQVPDGCVDLAVNVLPGPPDWLRDRLAKSLDDLSTYPDPVGARAAVARRHDRPVEEVLLLDGAAEGFWLIARALRPRLAACVHPSFTEGEAALRTAGVPVARIMRNRTDWQLDVEAVPDRADLVLIGRPDNPTGVLDPLDAVAALCRPGRTVVVDEAFAELLPDADGVAGRRDLPGLVAVRSLTKIWGLAGLRVGYLLADERLVQRLDAVRQPWSVNSVALTAIEACLLHAHERRDRADQVAAYRAHLLDRLRAVPGVETWPSVANFVLLRTPRPDLRQRLLERGYAVRRGETFPGLDEHHMRVAVRDPEISDDFVAALRDVLEGP